MSKSLVYNNRLDARSLLLWIGYEVVFVATFYLISCVIQDNLRQFILNSVLLTLSIVFSCYQWSRNKYVIQDGYLVFEEYTYLGRQISQRIRVDDIDDVTLKWGWKHLQKMVEIEISGITYQLEAVSHTKELYQVLTKNKK